MAKFKKIIQSQYAIYVLFLLLTICWSVKASTVCAIISAIYMITLLLFCTDIKNAFAPILYISFFIQFDFDRSHLIVYFIAFGLLILSLIYYLVKHIVKYKLTLQKGNMFWGFVCLAVAFLLGGLFFKIRPLEKLVMVGAVLVAYLFYFIAINFCENLKPFLLKTIMAGAVALSIETIILLISSGDVLSAIIDRKVTQVGAQNINVVSLFICLGMLSAFGLGHKNKYDYLYYIIATFLALSVCLCFCRMNIALAGLAFVGLTTYSFATSENKVQYTLVITVTCLFVIAFSKDLSIIVGSILSKFGSGGNGRNYLWPWCWDKFTENPWFGVGFISDETVPSLNTVVKIILAHNTVLQYFTSVGVIGTIIVAYFYYKKYKVCFTRPSAQNAFLIMLIIFIELTGLTDQAPTMDLFVLLLTTLTLASIEKNTQGDFAYKKLNYKNDNIKKVD